LLISPGGKDELAKLVENLDRERNQLLPA